MAFAMTGNAPALARALAEPEEPALDRRSVYWRHRAQGRKWFRSRKCWKNLPSRRLWQGAKTQHSIADITPLAARLWPWQIKQGAKTQHSITDITPQVTCPTVSGHRKELQSDKARFIHYDDLQAEFDYQKTGPLFASSPVAFSAALDKDGRPQAKKLKAAGERNSCWTQPPPRKMARAHRECN